MSTPAPLHIQPAKGVARFSIEVQPTQADGTRYAMPTVDVRMGPAGQVYWAGLSPAQARQAAAQLLACADAAEAP